MQNVIQVSTRSQSTKSEAYSINGTCNQADYWLHMGEPQVIW